MRSKLSVKGFGLNSFRIIFFFLIQFSFSQNGPGGIGSTDGKSALKLWLDADQRAFTDTTQKTAATSGDRLKLWKDLSGSNNDVFAVTDTNRPIFYQNSPYFNQKAAVRFHRDLDSNCRRNFLVSKDFTKTNDITIYCVFHAVSKSLGNNVSPFKFKGYHENMWYNGSGLVDAGVEAIGNDVSLAFCDTSIAAGVGDSTTGFDYSIKIPAAINQTFVASMSKEAWSGLLKIEHNYNFQNPFQAGNQPINQSEKYFIGSTSDVLTGKTQPFFDGFIATVLVYNKILTTAEKIILENYLSAKYDTRLVYNDFFKMDNSENGDFDFEMFGIGKSFDGSLLTKAKGEGIIEMTARDLKTGEFVMIAHNGKPLNIIDNNLPEGLQFRLQRKWGVSTTKENSTVDLVINLNDMPGFENLSPVLLIDTDGDSSFENEALGKGIIQASHVSSDGRVVFANVELKDHYIFSFGALKSGCIQDCENYFSPNGDGVADVFYINKTGNTKIFDRAGRMIREINTPAFWDGTTNGGDLAYPGLYFLVSENKTFQTVTLIR
ncbi:MAG: gliding motility-associated C-terminal domain-containing protein [Cytophagales bacterium]